MRGSCSNSRRAASGATGGARAASSAIGAVRGGRRAAVAR